MVNRGKLFAVDGTDCSGKETQTNMLVERMGREGLSVATMSFPRYDTPTGRIIAGPYLGKPAVGQSWFERGPVSVDPLVAAAFYAADRRAALPEMNRILDSGTHLVLDRYVSANMGHQGAKIERADERRALWEKLDVFEYDLMGLPRPDLTIFLHMPYQVGMELGDGRGEAKDGHERSSEHLRLAEQAYSELAELYCWVRVDCAPDGTRGSLRTPDEIGTDVYSIVRGHLASS